jgi:hypothetical protein
MPPFGHYKVVSVRVANVGLTEGIRWHKHQIKQNGDYKLSFYFFKWKKRKGKKGKKGDTDKKKKKPVNGTPEEEDTITG